MRNLKKILALVLALVMSLSLMATASAADFKDASDISDNYQTAVSVLSQLEVFKGYAEDGTFRPQGEITRAEVATIIYRIATGDAKDAQASIYTNMTTSFTDLDKAEWARGYVNYCHNAQIIKGESATKFNPNGKITGYATLAMILRAMGYGRNGEFEGSQWEINTAAKAKEIGIIDNVMEAQLGSNAPRELVAEILFRALLTEMVDYTVLNGYVKNGKTLGYEHFKLEELEGVIVANEFANLYGTSVLANGKTKLEVAADDIRDLAVTTEITDIGMRQHVYITGSTVLDMDDTDLNKVTETGAATDISSASKFASTADMSQGSGTEFYTNFGRSGYNSSDYRIEYEMSVHLTATELKAYTDDIARVGIANAWFTTTNNSAKLAVANVTANNGAYYDYVYHRVIPVCNASVLAKTPASQITAFDMDNIQSIFYRSNGIYWNSDNTTNNNYIGRVYVATQTKDDISDEISYNEFVDKYINELSYEISWGTSANGEWVKFIDNDLDGVCDYAFLTRSRLDEALDTYTKGDKTYVEYNGFDEEHATVRYMDGNTPAVGDKVIAALIDGQWLVEPAKDVTKTVNVYNWRDDKITTTDGEEYGQSGITNATDMQGLLKTMDEKTEYIMYFDHFGYVRAYELPGGTQYALITEIYANNNFNGNIVRNTPMTVELTAGDADTAEYTLSNGSTSEFIALAPWTLSSSVVGTYSYNNWLQPAIAHLGVTRTGCGPVRATPSFANTGNYSFWPAWRQIVRAGIVPGTTSNGVISQEFKYGTQNIGINNAAQQNVTSYTNVGIVNINDNTATVTGAAQLALDSNGNLRTFPNGQVRYAVEYVQLSTAPVVADQTMYTVNANYGDYGNRFVNATHETEFYIVYDGGVHYFKDYVNMPALTAENNIHAAYAVARDTSADNAAAPYWVADVIVYEVQNWNDDTRTSVALAYYNQSRTTGDTQLLKTLSNVTGGPEVDLVPAPLTWGADRGSFGDFSGYKFYQVWNGSDVTDGQMTARKITAIPETGKAYADYGIRVGTVTRVNLNAELGGYITVNVPTTNALGALVNTEYSVSVSDNVYSITNDRELGSTNDYNEANKLRYSKVTSDQVLAGDRVIIQGGKPTDANWISSAYIVDLGNPTTTEANYPLWTATSPFLKVAGGLYDQILADQRKTPAAGDDCKVVVKYVVPNDYPAVADKTLATIKQGNTVTIADLLTKGNTGITPKGLMATKIEAPTANGNLSATLSDNSTTTTTSGANTVATDANGFKAASYAITTSTVDKIEITITYAWANYTITGGTYTAPSATVPGVTGVNVNGAALATSATTTARYGNGSKNVDLVVTLDKPYDNRVNDLVVTIYKTGTTAPNRVVYATPTVSWSYGATSFTTSFEMPDENVTVDVEILAKATNITVSGDAGVTGISSWGSGVVSSTAWINGSATAKDYGATTITPIMAGKMFDTVTVTATDANGAAVTMTEGTHYTVNAAAGTVSLTTACAGLNVTVSVTTKALVVEYNVEVKTVAAGAAGDPTPFVGAITVGKNANFTGNVQVPVTAAASATPVPVTGLKVQPNDTLYIDVIGVAANGVTVTVSDGTTNYVVVGQGGTDSHYLASVKLDSTVGILGNTVTITVSTNP